MTISEEHPRTNGDEVVRRAELRRFLQSKRAAIDPSQVGFPVQSGRRRRRGLRIEEAAALVGVGITWYSAFERGRPIRVSRNMLDSVARALFLTDAEAAYLRGLVEPLSPKALHSTTFPKVYLDVINGFTSGPAFILNGRWDVLAWNSLAAETYFLSEDDVLLDRNLIWRMFTDERYERMHKDWERLASQMVAILHMQYGKHAHDPEYQNLIADLGRHDSRFERLWMTYKVSDYVPTIARLDHPTFGQLELNYVSFDVAAIADSAPSIRIVLQPPVPGSDTAQRLQAKQTGQRRR